MDKTVSSKYRINKKANMILGITVAIIPVIYSDLFGLLPIISSLAIVYLVAGDLKQKDNNVSINYRSILLVLLSTGAVYLLYYMITINKWNNGISFNNEIILLPTYAMLPVFIVPIIYMCSQKSDVLKNSFRLDRESAKITFIMLIVFIYHSLARISPYLQERLNVSDNMAIHMIVQAFFVAALAEELFFRGYLYNLLKKTCRICVAQHISAFIFTFSHFNLLFRALNEGLVFRVFSNYIAIYFLGWTMAYIYERKKSLIPCILFHACIDSAIKYIFILVLNNTL